MSMTKLKGYTSIFLLLVLLGGAAAWQTGNMPNRANSIHKEGKKQSCHRNLNIFLIFFKGWEIIGSHFYSPILVKDHLGQEITKTTLLTR